jgi:hypothetical protein
MEYPTSFVNVAGNALAGFGTILSGGAWIVGLAPGEAISAATVERAGSAGLLGLVAGIATLVVNGLIADRRDKRRLEERKIDADSRFLELQLNTVKLIAEARADEQRQAAGRLEALEAREGERLSRALAAFARGEGRGLDLGATATPGGVSIPTGGPAKTGLEPPK